MRSGMVSSVVADTTIGAPGVGKTATAECVADLVEKPLYPLTCGDLGHTATQVEQKLRDHF